jgi:hypothetical protein
MKVNPVSVLTYVRWDHMYKAVFEKNEQNGNVKIEEQKFPLYNNKAEIVQSVQKGNKIDIKI